MCFVSEPVFSRLSFLGNLRVGYMNRGPSANRSFLTRKTFDVLFLSNHSSRPSSNYQHSPVISTDFRLDGPSGREGENPISLARYSESRICAVHSAGIRSHFFS